MACVPGAEILLSQAGGVFSDDYIEALRQGPHRDQARWSEALRLNMIWTLAENGIFQGNMFTRLAVALVLTGLVGYRGLGAAPERTDALFSRHLGIGAYEYVLVVLALWAYAQHDSLISTANIIQEGPKKAQLTRAVANVAAALSRRVDRFRDLSDSPSFSTYTGKALPSALFQRWPLIQINESHFVVSAHPFLKVQFSSKFLTKALALARAEAPREEQGRTAVTAR